MFHFKRFSIDDSGSAMKVGTDGVLLGAWCSVGCDVGRILDVGTGSGLIALMLAQRTQRTEGQAAIVDGIEIDDVSAAQARTNVEGSEWGERINIYSGDFQSYTSDAKYDLIVSNPPYFVDSLLPPDAGRGVARHTTELTFEALVDGVCRLLNKGGRFAVILPVEESLRVDEIIEQSGAGLKLTRRCGVQNSAKKSLKRYMSEYIFQSEEVPTLEQDLLMIREGSPLEYSAKYRELTADFYLKF